MLVSFLKARATLAKSGSWLIPAILRFVWCRSKGKKLLLHSKVRILGLRNIVTAGGMVVMGELMNETADGSDRTRVDVRGRLIFRDAFHLARGCRVDIGPDAECSFGASYINCGCRLVIRTGLEIGDGTGIAWGCEIVDADFHQLNYEGKTERPRKIRIGNKVWIGAGVRILKGVEIADGCVVAAGTILTKSFLEPNCLIGGNPARVLRQNVSWA
jgi:acetyltransferase-like isoleucine patch superfamily enzyme